MGQNRVEHEVRSGAFVSWTVNPEYSPGAVSMGGPGAAMPRRYASGGAGVGSPAWKWARRRLPWLAGLAIVVLAGVVFARATVYAPVLREALETMMTLFAFAAAWLLRSQFAHSRRLADLLLLGASLAMGLVNLAAAVLPGAFTVHGSYFPGADLFGRLLVAAIFAGAAFAPSRHLRGRSRQPAAIVATLLLVSLLVAAIGGLLSTISSPDAPALSGLHPHPLWLAVVLGKGGLLACAAAGFARRHRAGGDGAAAQLAVAMTLLAGVNLSALLAPTIAAARVGPDQALRVIAFALILLAALTLERRVHRQLTTAAAVAERRRVARDLHDGLAQDLAVIAAQASSIAPDADDDHPVVVAARRALAVSRGTILDLTDPANATAQDSLEAVAQELRARFDLTIAVDVQVEGEVGSEVREHMTRIAREAIANAARHSGARNVVVAVRRVPSGIALRVADDGCGIVQAEGQVIHEGFGLRSMCERAAALGGRLNVRPARGGGTELEVLLP